VTEEPRAESERNQVGRARARLFELTIRFVDRLERIVDDPAATNRDIIAAARVVFERTMPKVRQLDVQALVNLFRQLEDQPKDAPIEAEREQLREAIRRFSHGLGASGANGVDAANGNGAIH
jgi:hypothetical protein